VRNSLIYSTEERIATMTSSHENKRLSAEEKAFIDHLAAQYAPSPMTPAQRVTFDQKLAARIARRTHFSLLRPGAVVATACAALLLWLTMPPQGPDAPEERAQPNTLVVVGEDATSPAGEENLLTYAYYSPEFYEGDDEEEDESFLPEEYEELATAFASPDA
jgi:hypothetical protein